MFTCVYVLLERKHQTREMRFNRKRLNDYEICL